MGSFRFGTDSIDRLISKDGLFGAFHAESSEKLSNRCEPFVGCIVGPDGTGKSILALQAAATYRADSRFLKDTVGDPLIIYFSTDLSFSQATSVWNGFGLNRPLERANLLANAHTTLFSAQPSTEELSKLYEAKYTKKSAELSLVRIRPLSDASGGESIVQLCDESRWGDAVAFVDLAADSAGDDWSLINRVLGHAASVGRNQSGDQSRPHLVIIDAVEGLEALVGEHDAFGLVRTRRSRLAQMIRLAKRSNVSLIFIIEETKDQERLAEVFVSDLVIRLRAIKNDDYLQRTIEVEKARGGSHIRGEQDFVIRSGLGTKTLGKPNKDDPELITEANTPLAYLLAIPTLHVRTRELKEEARRPLEGSVFGLREIDDLLRSSAPIGQATSDPKSRILAIIGDSGTHKTELMLNFIRCGIKIGNGEPEGDPSSSGGLVFSSDRMGVSFWAAYKDSISKESKGNNGVQLDSLLCLRHLPPVHLTSSQFLQIILTNIEAMKKALKIKTPDESYRLRVVIDNWSVLMETHPALRNDPILLHRLFWHLQEQGVLALFVSRQPGSPLTLGKGIRVHDIANLDIKKVCTWPVHFFSGQKVAITVFPPPGTGERNEIYGLDRVTPIHSGTTLRIDPHLLLYSGLEDGRPAKISLRVRLFGDGVDSGDENAQSREYSQRVSGLMDSLFADSVGSDGKSIVRFEASNRYDGYRDYVHSFDDSRLPYTEVLQVDQFWGAGQRSGLANLIDYWRGTTMRSTDGKACKQSMLEDPFGEYQIHPDILPKDRVRAVQRCAFLKSPWKEENKEIADATKTATSLFRIPQHADFGFILADRQLWWQAKDKVISELLEVQSGVGELLPEHEYLGGYAAGIKVGHIWNTMCCGGAEFPGFDLSEVGPLAGQVSWPLFFQVCSIVAEDRQTPSFDVDISTEESLACLILEIWTSFIEMFTSSFWRTTSVNPDLPLHREMNELQQALEVLSREGLFPNSEVDDVSTARTRLTLSGMIEKTWPLLFLAVEELRFVLPKGPSGSFRITQRSANASSVAIRTWYSTAWKLQNQNKNLVPLRMPGARISRGDWYIAVRSGSRSLLLAGRAIDKLLSADLTMRRLQLGVGLPRRILALSDEILASEENAVLNSNHHGGELRTCLVLQDPNSGVAAPVSLGELVKLAGRENNTANWLWRGNIQRYAEDSPLFSGMIGRYLTGMDRESILRDFFVGGSVWESLVERVKSGDSNEKLNDLYLEAFCNPSELEDSADEGPLLKLSYFLRCTEIFASLAVSGSKTLEQARIAVLNEIGDNG